MPNTNGGQGDGGSGTMIGKRLGHYELLEKIGAGGMGEVYRALDLKLHREVALKLLPAELAKNPEWVQRLTQEARAVAGLNHPNVVTIHSIEDAGERPFLTMELVSGRTLDQVIGPDGLSTKTLLDIAIPLADALSAAHAVGVVHRDLKPSNVMVTPSGHSKVLDFGLAKQTQAAEAGPAGSLSTAPMLTRVGAVMGTIPYMSPEQLQGRTVDARSDIFSFGALLFEMATGQRVHRGSSDAELISAILRDPPPTVLGVRADLPPALDAIIQRCLQKDPARRYQTSRDLSDELRALGGVAGSDPSARTVVSGATPPRGRQRHTVLALVGVLTGLLLVVGVWSARSRWGLFAAEPSVAVLPFVNVSHDENVDYLIDGIANGITNRLSESTDLKVMSQYSVARFKAGSVDALSAGRQLGVTSVLTGQLSVRGDKLVVDVALLDVEDGRQLWGERFERNRADFQSIEREIVGGTSEKLRVKLAAAALAKPVADPEAYDLYLQARYALSGGAIEALAHSQDLLRKAIARDPGLAVAYATLGDTYVTQAYLNPQDNRESLELAKANLKRASELDPNLPETYLLTGDVALYFDWDWAAAGAAYRKAIELSPSNDSARVQYSNYLLILDRPDDAIAEARMAQTLDPLSVNATHQLGFCFLTVGRYQEAVVEFQKAITLNPDWRWGNIKMGRSYAYLKDRERALAAVKRADDLLPAVEGSALSQAWLAETVFLCGDPTRTKRTLERLEQQALTKPVDPLVLAGLYILLNDRNRAFEALERGFQARDPSMVYLLILRRGSEWKEAVEDPRYLDLLKRMRFPRFQT